MNTLTSQEIACINNIYNECGGSYKCQMGIDFGINQTHAKHICSMFPTLNSCIANQTCINIGKQTFDSCIKTVNCTSHYSKNGSGNMDN